MRSHVVSYVLFYVWLAGGYTLNLAVARSFRILVFFCGLLFWPGFPYSILAARKTCIFAKRWSLESFAGSEVVLKILLFLLE